MKKATSGILTIVLCSCREGTLRAKKYLRPCQTKFFEQPIVVCVQGIIEDNVAVGIRIIQHSQERFFSTSRIYQVVRAVGRMTLS